MEQKASVALPELSSGLVRQIHDYLRNEDGVDYPPEIIQRSIRLWLERRLDGLLDDLLEVVETPHLAASQQFRELLDQQMQLAEKCEDAAEAATVQAEEPGTVFSGYKPYSPQKLGAMIEYISRTGRDIYKTSLNKLLFYSDLTYYYLHQRGISGATYVNMPYGPVPDGVECVLNDLSSWGRIRRGVVHGVGTNATLIKPGEQAPQDILSDDEKEVLDWVIGRYGDMSATGISALSHREKAYANTRPGEPIAYEYAKFFDSLPPKKQ